MDQRSGKEEWRKFSRAFFVHKDRSLLDPVQPADPRADEHTSAFPFLFGFRLVAGIGDGLLRRSDAVSDEVVDTPLILAIDPLVRIVAAVRPIAPRHVAGNPACKIIDLELRDRTR